MGTSLTIEMFGPMRVLVGNEPIPRTRSRKALWLLALLALRAGRPVTRERVANMLWPDAESGLGSANLRPVMCDLRAALGDEGQRLRSKDPNMIVLEPSGAKIDVVEFDAAFRKGDHTRAVELYRGQLLEGCPEEWAVQERLIRETNCLAALQALGKSALEEDRPAEAVAHFTRAIALDPLRDGPRRGLMTALAAEGNVNAALQTYREFAQLISSEVCTTPDGETASLYERLRADLRRPAGRSVVKASRPTPNNLVVPLTDLVGREEERLEAASRLRKSRLVTLMGVGGIGKTRLAASIAQEALSEYEEGVWWVALDVVSDERLVPSAVASALDVREEPNRPILNSVMARLRGGPRLVVLDNCEHLVKPAAALAAILLKGCPELRILTTSREALGLPGEVVCRVPTLECPDPSSLPRGLTTLLRVAASYESVQLFVERARCALPDFELRDDNVRAVVEICGRVEGVPLAIEIAAARTRSMTVEAIAERLRSHHLEALARRARGVSERQQTLRSTLDWSYDLLRPEERAALLRLAVFVGGWTLEAAREVIGGREASERLASLVDKSLVVFNTNSRRYRLLEPVRQYGLERLKAEGDAAGTRRRHREWFLGLAEQAEPGFSGPEQEAWSLRLNADADNLRAALASCDDAPEEGLRLIGSLSRYWMYRGFYEEGLAEVHRALKRPGADVPTPARAKALHGGAVMALGGGEPGLAQRFWQESLELRRAQGDREGVSLALCNLGNLAAEAKDYGKAVALIEEALGVQRESGNPTGVALVLCNLSSSLRRRGNHLDALPLITEGLAIYRELGDERMCSWALLQLGDIEFQKGDYASAKTHMLEALQQFRASDYGRGAAWTLEALSRVLVEIDPAFSADDMLAEAWAFFDGLKERVSAAIVEAAWSREALRRNDLSAARTRCESALTTFRALENGQGTAGALETLGEVAEREGNEDEAESHFGESLRIRCETGEVLGVPETLERLARRSPPEVAARLWGSADAMRRRLCLAAPPSRRGEQAAARERARAALGDDAFDRAWHRGASLDARELLKEALLRLTPPPAR